MSWRGEKSESFREIEARVAPINTLISVLESYSQEIKNGSLRFELLTPSGANKDFEKAIFERNDRYLDLLLAECVTDWGLARDLWHRSLAVEGSDPAYSLVLREQLLGGVSGLAMIQKSRSNINNSGQLCDLAAHLSKDSISEECVAILKNPNARRILPKLFSREDEFACIQDEMYVHFVRIAIENSGLNIDNSSTEGPDLTQMKLESSICNLLNSVEPSRDWLVTLEALFLQLDPSVYYLSGLDFKRFIQIWRDFLIPLEKYEEDIEWSPNKGFYTTLTAAQEMVSIFVAKFGGAMFAPSEVRFSTALASNDFVLQASFFGNREISAAELDKLVLGPANFGDISFWLCFNKMVVLDELCREKLLQYTKGSPEHHILKETIVRSQKKSKFFESVSDSKSFSVPERLMSDQNLSAGALTELKTDFSKRIKKLEDTTRYTFYGVVLAVILLFIAQD
jgi:hypothetical protein